MNIEIKKRKNSIATRSLFSISFISGVFTVFRKLSIFSNDIFVRCCLNLKIWVLFTITLGLKFLCPISYR